MKKRVCLLLVFALLLPVLFGCQTQQQPPETTEALPPDRSNFVLTPDPNQSEEEQAVLRILSIGNSHSQDSAWLLQEVLQSEFPDQKIVVSECYFPGAMTEHVANAMANEPVYDYQVNENGTWETAEGATIAYALKAQWWDVVVINESSRHIGLQKYLDKGLIEWFINYVDEQLSYDPYLMYNWTWAQPTDEAFYALDFDPQPPGTFKDTFLKDYGTRPKHYEMMVEMIDQYIEPNPNFDLVLYSATPVQYATEILGVPQTDLYRDYTHLSDYGRLYSAYMWYAQLFGLESIDSVKLDVVRQPLRNRRFKHLGDLELTEEMKNDFSLLTLTA